MLDGSDYEIQVDQKVIGQEVFDKVCEHISLLEKDYFGCTFREKDTKFWLQLDKKISKQISGNWVLTFAVKYYPPNPAVMLKEEITRYLLFLQLRTDINAGRMPCSFVTQALLGSYAAQSQIGDYDEGEYGEGIGHLKGILFVQNQNEELLEKIAELHQTHRGDSPGAAELAYLENAKNVAMYGVHMYPVKVEGDTMGNVSVGVCAIGLLIYKDRLRTNRFCWAKIIKISFKRDKFFIKLRPEENERKGVKWTCKLPDVPRAKQLWRIAMEHHLFFRMKAVEARARSVFTRAGGYKFTGRTLLQAQDASKYIQRTGHDFTRGASTRFVSSKSLNNLMTGGYSTEREEQHIAEAAHPAATLNIRKVHGSQGSLHFGDYDLHDDNMADGYNMIAGQMVDRYGRPIDLDPNANLNPGYDGQFAYNQYQGNPYDGNYPDSDLARMQGHGGGYGNGFGAGQYGLDASRTGTMSSRGMSPNPLGNIQPTRDKYGNVIIKKNRMTNGSASSEDDRIMEHGYGRDVGEDGDWNRPGAYGVGKTTTRTYSTPNGTLVTEYRTEKNGVIETRVEKRTRESEYEDIDYDALLARAIRDVTDMDPDLAVEKIVIHTKGEETMA